MSDQLVNGVLATLLGTALAVGLFLPVAWVEYRRDGRLGPGDLALLLSGAVYAIALWTYTLLPMPSGSDVTCVGRQTTPFATIGDVDWGAATTRVGLSALVHDGAAHQVVLNVLLFVPLGFYVRRLLHRGVVVATVVGFGVSLLIETTQGTGVWGLYDCAYRVLDVDDLVVNTLGAAVGSLAAALVVRRRRREIVLPTEVSLGRRLVGMVCDLLVVVFLGGALVIAYRAVQLYGFGVAVDDIPQWPQDVLQWGVPAALELAAVLLAGRTVGEWVVAVRAVPRTTSARPARPVLPARLVKFAAGVGGAIALMATSAGWSGPALVAFAILSVACAAGTTDRRGLAQLAAGMTLEVVPPRPARSRLRSAS